MSKRRLHYIYNTMTRILKSTWPTSFQPALTLMLFLVLGACQQDEYEIGGCGTMIYFESSAVCTSSIEDAAIRTEAGEIFIVKNFFELVDRNEATVGRAFEAKYNLITRDVNSEICGALIDAPWVTLACIEVAE